MKISAATDDARGEWMRRIQALRMNARGTDTQAEGQGPHSREQRDNEENDEETNSSIFDQEEEDGEDFLHEEDEGNLISDHDINDEDGSQNQRKPPTLAVQSSQHEQEEIRFDSSDDEDETPIPQIQSNNKGHSPFNEKSAKTTESATLAQNDNSHSQPQNDMPQMRITSPDTATPLSDDDESDVSTDSDDLQDVNVDAALGSPLERQSSWKEKAQQLRNERSPRALSLATRNNPFAQFAVKRSKTIIASKAIEETPDTPVTPVTPTEDISLQDQQSPVSRDAQAQNSTKKSSDGRRVQFKPNDPFDFFDSDDEVTAGGTEARPNGTQTEATNALSTDGSSDEEFERARSSRDDDDEDDFLQQINQADDRNAETPGTTGESNLVFTDELGSESTFLANRGKSISLEKQILFPKSDLDIVINKNSPLTDGVQREPGTLLISQIRDNRNIQNDISYKAIMQMKGDDKVLWSGRVLKINQKLRHFKRIMVVNKSGVLVLYKNKRNDNDIGGDKTPGSASTRKPKYSFKKWIPFTEISHVLFSDDNRQSLLAAILLPSRHKDLLFEFPSKALKKEFLDHVEDVHFATVGKKLNLLEVVDVKLPVRLNRGERKQEPVPLSEDQKLISHDTDQCKLADDPKWRNRLRKFGDRHVYFSETVEKVKTAGVKHLKIKAKRMFIITDRAVYNCKQDTTVKRRIELSDITQLWLEERNSKSLLFVVPTETKDHIKSYDLYIKFKTSLDSHRKRKVVRDILIQLVPNIQVHSGKDIKHHLANLNKTVEYRAMLRKRMDPEVVKAQLKQAIISKDEGILEKAIETAKRIDLESDKYYIVAVKELQRIRDSAAIKKQWDQAEEEDDVKGMKFLLEKAERLKPHMTQFVKVVAPRYMRLVNEKIFVKKMQMAIETRDTVQIKDIFAKATMAGLHEQVAYFQKQYYVILQREYTSEIVEKLIEQNDVDALRLVVKNAESFMTAEDGRTLSKRSSKNVSGETITRTTQELLHYAKQFYQENRDLERARKQLMKKVHEASLTNNVVIIEKAIEHACAEFPNLKTATNAITVAETAIQKIHTRQKQREDLFSAIQHKDKKRLQQLVELTEEDEYLEDVVQQAQSTLNLLRGGEAEVKRLEQVRSLKTRFREIFKVFKLGDKGDLSMLKELVDNSRIHPELVNQIKAAESLISNLEQKRREETLLAKEDLDAPDALNASDIDSSKFVDICAEEAEKYAVMFFETGKTIFENDKHSAVEETLEMERLIRRKIESKDIVEIKRMLLDAQNHPGLDDVIQEAVDAIDRFEYNHQLGEKLDQLIVAGKREELSQFISENKESMDAQLLKRARNAWKDIWDEEQKIGELKEMLTSLLKSASYTKKDILERAIRKAEPYAIKDEGLMHLVDLLLGTLNGSDEHLSGKQHHLIQILYESIVKLLRSFKKMAPGVVNGDSSMVRSPFSDKIEVQLHNPHGQTVVRNLHNIFSAHTKRYWFKDRTTWDIFKGMRHSVIQNAVREFESFDAVKTLPSDNFSTTASLLFIQYMLDRGYFSYCINEFLDDNKYIAECYTEQSLFLDENHKDALRGILSLLDQFRFKYGFENDDNIRAATQYSADYIISHPISEIKDAVQEIVQYFFINSSEGSEQDLHMLGDDTKNIEIALLVRDKLCKPLFQSFEHGFKKGLFATASIWNFIEDVAEEKENSALDLGGIGLPQAVITVNEVVKNYDKAKEMQADQLADIKFKCFICYGLNDHQLGDFVKSVLRAKSMMNSFYEPNALLCRENIQLQLVAILQKLNNLPFQLTLDPSLY